MTEKLFYFTREEGRSPKIARVTCYTALTPEGFTQGAMVREGLVMVGNNRGLAEVAALLVDNNETLIYLFDPGVQEAAFRRGFRKNVLKAVRQVRAAREIFNKT